jgi:putative ABC transport system substrate-binding protein
MKRREFITLLGGGATASLVIRPTPGRAGRRDGVRRIGVLSGLAEDDPESRVRALSFERGLRDLGWINGRNLQIERRWAGDGSLLAKYSAELVALAPELILANTTPVVTALRELTGTVPILFVQVTDPVGEGLVASFAQPGGNVTGITNFDFSIGSKWLEILKEIAPRVTRVAIVFNPDTAPFADLFIQPIEAAAPSFAITVMPASARDPAELERVIDDFAKQPNGALLVMPDVSAVNHRNRIIAQAARQRLPAIYPYRLFAASGGLVSYGSDVADIYRRIASYVDRILRGTPPANMPVEAPTKFELVINLQSAKSLQLDMPARLVTLADDVIE